METEAETRTLAQRWFAVMSLAKDAYDNISFDEDGEPSVVDLDTLAGAVGVLFDEVNDINRALIG